MPAKKNLHKKPTTEELDENMKKSLEELDKIEGESSEEESEEPGQEDEEVSASDDTRTEEEESDPKSEEPSEDEEPEEPEGEPTKPQEPKEDLAKRYSDSTREAQILYSKNKKMTEAIEHAGDVPEPTEEELKEEYPEWEEMSDFERRVAKDNLHNNKKLGAITEATKEFRELDEWSGKVDTFLSDEKTFVRYPELDGKEDEFQVFATKPTRMGVDLSDLVSAFLYHKESTRAPSKKGQMFESGTGGSRTKAKSKGEKITTEESIALRETNYKEYQRLLREGKIEDPE